MLLRVVNSHGNSITTYTRLRNTTRAIIIFRLCDQYFFERLRSISIFNRFSFSHADFFFAMKTTIKTGVVNVKNELRLNASERTTSLNDAIFFTTTTKFFTISSMVILSLF